MRLVLDTSVLIDHLRGRPQAATALIPNAIARGDELWSSQVVRAELLAGMRADEEVATRDLLRLITWVDVDESMSEAAGALGRRYLRSYPGIEVADLLVAALVQHLDGELKTTNVKHFPMFRELKPPY
jgi:predicted nucleic acid-binding protein